MQYAPVKEIENCPGLWLVSPYIKCDLACQYCCTQAQGKSIPSEKSAIEIWEAIQAIPKEDMIVFGAYSDAYVRAEAVHGITREILSLLAREARPITIVTKSTLVLRDLDILQRLGTNVQVQISLSTTNEDYAAQLEPAVVAPAERLALVRQLYRAGIAVAVNAAPWIPGVSDLRDLLNAIPKNVPVTVSPLETGEGETCIHLRTGTYQRDEILRKYRLEYQRYADCDRLIWVQPNASGTHNPLFLLPSRVSTRLAPDWVRAKYPVQINGGAAVHVIGARKQGVI